MGAGVKWAATSRIESLGVLEMLDPMGVDYYRGEIGLTTWITPRPRAMTDKDLAVLDPAILARYRTAAEELVVEIQRVGREFRAQFPGLGDS